MTSETLTIPLPISGDVNGKVRTVNKCLHLCDCSVRCIANCKTPLAKLCFYNISDDSFRAYVMFTVAVLSYY